MFLICSIYKNIKQCMKFIQIPCKLQLFIDNIFQLFINNIFIIYNIIIISNIFWKLN